MVPATPHNAPGTHFARTCQLWLRITDQRGVSAWYTCKPLPGPMLTYRLIRHDGPDFKQDATYLVSLLSPKGPVRCTCPGGRDLNRCKHMQALLASGLIQLPLPKPAPKRRPKKQPALA